ncbi:MAG: hypothetical protein IJD51_01645 [Clostridia bacterium]|nr:hypothetical protein [Clostridia bacterium]
MANLKIKIADNELVADGDHKALSEYKASFLDFVAKRDAFLAGERFELTEVPREEVIAENPQPAPNVKDEVVVIYDNAGIPSIMRRFSLMRNNELFEGGSTVEHPAFVIGGEVYDEIYISVYPNCNINGKPYSLPGMKPWTNVTIDDAANACFSKGDGWHLMTAPEWGLLANISLKNGTLPHGNTDCGHYHADHSEKGIPIESGSPYTLTGTGPATWTHDHTVTGVHDLCGNVYEFVRGLRFKDGEIQIATDNDAALPETDLSKNGSGWSSMAEPMFVDTSHGVVRFTKEKVENDTYEGGRWKDVECSEYTEGMKELAIYPGEPEVFCGIDGTEGEWLAYRGGYWGISSSNGVFYLGGNNPRAYTNTGIGFRSAYFKRKTDN